MNELIGKGTKFDYIICSDLIGSLDDIQSVFKRLNSLSHDRTKTIVTYYNYFWNPILKLGSWLHLKMKEGEQNWLYIDEIQNLLYLTDYEVYKRGSLLLFPKISRSFLLSSIAFWQGSLSLNAFVSSGTL